MQKPKRDSAVVMKLISGRLDKMTSIPLNSVDPCQTRGPMMLELSARHFGLSGRHVFDIFGILHKELIYILSRATFPGAPSYGGMRTWVEGSQARWLKPPLY